MTMHLIQSRWLFVLCLLIAPGLDLGGDEHEGALPNEVTDSPLLNSRFILFGSDNLRRQTLRWASRRGDTDMVAPLIYSLRYLKPEDRLDAVAALEKITKRGYGDDWFRWMQWQQAQTDITPFAGFDVFLSGLFGSLDEGFGAFVYPGVQHTIRLEEIVWGGVVSRDGIPALNNPKLLSVEQADYLTDKDAVFGVVINGDARAYPYRIMDWHEMLNDVVGGVPVSLAYCTLCGAGILFDTRTDGAPYRFGSSGLLYRSNKLMFDEATDSLWNQFTGQPVVGKLAGASIRLPTLPIVTTTWGEWRAQHPNTQVLDIDTGYTRDYRPGKPYGNYFRSGRLMFPTTTNDRQLRQKEVVFGLRAAGANRAWPLKRFKTGQVIHDQVGVVPIVLIGNAASRTVRAYRSEGIEFAAAKGANGLKDLSRLTGSGQLWQVTEAGLVAEDGRVLGRLPGHLAYWFAWHNYLGGETLSK